ncbi:hypothetical protein NKG94_08340 [Micromonospora sp. M12]
MLPAYGPWYDQRDAETVDLRATRRGRTPGARGQRERHITQAVRDRMRLDALDAELAHQGIPITEQGVAEARARRAAVEADWSPERRSALRERARLHTLDATTGTVDQPAA